MSQEALDRHIGTLKDSGTLLIDEGLVKNVPDVDRVTLYRIPSTRVAAEELRRRIVANMVMLGALVGATSVVSEKALKAAVKESVPPGTEELNFKALEHGIKLAQEVE
jgi:2-oxoglutarate ferredoxin oxidoreductase subunit gamma